MTISDELYERLEAEARRRGLTTVEEFLEGLQIREADRVTVRK